MNFIMCYPQHNTSLSRCKAAGTAACISIDKTLSVQDVPYSELSARLCADGQVLSLKNDK
jgi:hypothetical protein